MSHLIPSNACEKLHVYPHTSSIPSFQDKNYGMDAIAFGNLSNELKIEGIRRAYKNDVHAIFQLTREAVQNETLLNRTEAEIKSTIGSFYVYEKNREIIGCVTLLTYLDSSTIEIGCLCVDSNYQRKGIGKQLMAFSCARAFEFGAEKVIALSAKSYPFLKHLTWFTEGSLDDLPEARKKSYLQNKRASHIFYCATLCQK